MKKIVSVAAGMPRPIVALLNERIRKTMTAPEQRQRFHDRGLDVIASTPDAFSAHLKKESEKWGRVIKERGMRAE
ncbi:Tripartite tricarboxylate transporter family receptor [compost metagenome]